MTRWRMRFYIYWRGKGSGGLTRDCRVRQSQGREAYFTPCDAHAWKDGISYRSRCHHRAAKPWGHYTCFENEKTVVTSFKLLTDCNSTSKLSQCMPPPCSLSARIAALADQHSHPAEVSRAAAIELAAATICRLERLDGLPSLESAMLIVFIHVMVCQFSQPLGP